MPLKYIYLDHVCFNKILTRSGIQAALIDAQLDRNEVEGRPRAMTLQQFGQINVETAARVQFEEHHLNDEVDTDNESVAQNEHQQQQYESIQLNQHETQLEVSQPNQSELNQSRHENEQVLEAERTRLEQSREAFKKKQDDYYNEFFYDTAMRHLNLEMGGDKLPRLI
jgi:phosphatidate phosphatase PAH1